MDWQDSRSLDTSLSSITTEKRDNIFKFYCYHCFVFGSMPGKQAQTNSDYMKYLIPSSYGKGLIEKMQSDSFSKQDTAFASLGIFFHRDFLIDFEASDLDGLKRTYESDLQKGALKLPDRFLRTAYDRFNDLPGDSRIERLDAEASGALYVDLEQGIYQIGSLIAGPLGISNSEEQRFLPPSRRVPLFHCADPGCQFLHSVVLERHPHSGYDSISELKSIAESAEGAPSEWDGVICDFNKNLFKSSGRRYIDLPPLLAEALSPNERDALFERALKVSSQEVRRRIGEIPLIADLSKKNDLAIMQGLSRGGKLQLLLSFSNKQIVEILDSCVKSRAIKIPLTETRTAKSSPPHTSNYDSRCSLSMYGLRSDQENAVAFFCSVVWAEFEKSGRLADLAWVCRKTEYVAYRSEPMVFLQNHTVREAIEQIILPNRSIVLNIAQEIDLHIDTDMPSDLLVTLFLWKFGFDPPRFDEKYARLNAQLVALREEAVRHKEPMNDDQRDQIRARGAVAFVALENFIEELVTFSVWLLGGDHFGYHKFNFNFKEASVLTHEILSPLADAKLPVPLWRPQGGNVLSTLMYYGRIASNWMTGLVQKDRSSLEKSEDDIPHFKNDPVSEFLLRHSQLWADLPVEEIRKYAEKFNSLITQLEASRLAEVRNGLDHYREEDKFPTLDVIIGCASRLLNALNEADEYRMLPKTFWLKKAEVSDFGLREYHFQDYKGRKLRLGGPRMVAGLKSPVSSRPLIIPPGNLLGQPNAEMIFRLDEESEYTKMWLNYPRRRIKSSSEDLQSEASKCP